MNVFTIDKPIWSKKGLSEGGLVGVSLCNKTKNPSEKKGVEEKEGLEVGWTSIREANKQQSKKQQE